MVNKIGFKAIGQKRPDVTPPNVLREQAKYFQLGKLQARPKWWHVIIALLVTVVIIVIAATVVIKVMWSAPNLDASKYQAVFLEDGKVFFGKLKNTDGAYVTLEGAYYTRSTGNSDNAANTDQTALVQVGTESYGPQDSIQIARSKIIFWQNLRDDSQVTKAINSKIGQ